MRNQAICHRLNSSDELRTEHQYIHLCQISTVKDFIRGIPEIKRNSKCTGLKNTKVNGQPLKTVHHEDGNLIPLLHTTGEEHIGKPIGFFIKDTPCDFTTIRSSNGGLNQGIFLPGHPPIVLLFRIKLYQRNLITI